MIVSQSEILIDYFRKRFSK